MKIVALVLVGCAFFYNGCSSVQETYKPLYQVEPQKVELEVVEK
jgi:PBP1b-binding outer membrane lipoprotein LpoB